VVIDSQPSSPSASSDSHQVCRCTHVELVDDALEANDGEQSTGNSGSSYCTEDDQTEQASSIPPRLAPEEHLGGGVVEDGHGGGEGVVEVEVELGRVLRVMAEVDECVGKIQLTQVPPGGVVVVVVVVRRSMLGMPNGSKVAFQLGLGIESCGGRSGHSRRTFMSANHSSDRDGDSYIHFHLRLSPIDPT